MTLFYSASTNGFYDDDINKNIPKNSVEITREKHKELLDAQTNEKVIQADKNGNPVLKDKPIVEPLVLTALEKLEKVGITVDELKFLLGL